MPRRLHFTALALTAALALPTAGHAQSDSPGAFYLSTDDFRLVDDGIIIPIIEYVKVSRSMLGAQELEIGYQHLLPMPESMLNILVSEYYHWDRQVTDFGKLDLVNTRRITVTGRLDTGADVWTWEPDVFAPTLNEPALALRTGQDADQVIRYSPFQQATGTAVGTAQIRIVTLDDATLAVQDLNGVVHSYVRTDPDVARMVGLLAAVAEISIGLHYECLWPIAETLVAGEDYLFSDAAKEEVARQIRGVEGAIDTWQEMQARGLGGLFAYWMNAVAESERLLGQLLQARVDQFPNFVSFAETLEPAEPIFGQDDQLIVVAIERLHMFDFDYLAGERPPFDNMGDMLFHIAEGPYAEDPFAVTAPMMTAFDRGGWVPLMTQLIYWELELTCDSRY